MYRRIRGRWDVGALGDAAKVEIESREFEARVSSAFTEKRRHVVGSREGMSSRRLGSKNESCEGERLSK